LRGGRRRRGVGVVRYCGSGGDRAAGSSFVTFFAGTDLWRDGAFLNGGLLWSPAGLDTSGGFTLLVQNYRLTPYDPGSRLHGFYAGGQLAGDVWYQPDPATMIALDGSIASIGLIGSARAAIGWRSSEPFFVGPETQVIWCLDYQQLRVGAHVTGFRIDALEWTAAGGWAMESDRRAGPYLRLGVNTRYRASRSRRLLTRACGGSASLRWSSRTPSVRQARACRRSLRPAP
jgi:hypothetical protein